MNHHQLDTFIQVADAGSFSKAAEALFISPTAVMKQINLLEGSLGVQLFARTPRGLTLTNGGKSYYQDAKYMIQYAKDAQTRAHNATQSNDNVIRIGTSLMTPSQFLMDLWPQVHEIHPEVQIIDFPFYNLEVFNQCEHENALLMAVPQWEGVHPLLKILPVEWNHSIPFGLLHSPTPSPTVQKLIRSVAQIMNTKF